MPFLMTFGYVETVGLGKRNHEGKTLCICEMTLLTETGSLELAFNNADDLASLPSQDQQRYPAMVELISQCHLAQVPVTIGYDSDGDGMVRNALQSIEVSVNHFKDPLGDLSKVERVILKGNGMNSASFEFSHDPPSALGTRTLVLEQPLTRLSGAIAAALVRGIGIRVTEEAPGTTSPSAVGLALYTR